jgi:hypothetical protein
MAAGLGFKTFTTGEVLTAADTNGYLMQGINVFASTAARDAAITAPQEGQFAFTKDTNGLWYYDGAAWVASGATGDIEGVTAGVGITGGGTSGTVTITNDMATTITASGDIVVGTGSGTYDNLPIGTTGQILTADTTVSPYKVKWATAASGSALTKIVTGTFSAVANTGTTFDGCFTSTYKNYLVQFNGGASADNELQVQNRVSGATQSAAQYYGGRFGVAYTGANATYQWSAATFYTPIHLPTGGTTNSCTMTFSQVGNGSQTPGFYSSGYSNANNGLYVAGGITANSYNADGFILSVPSGTITGTCVVYGLAN